MSRQGLTGGQAAPRRGLVAVPVAVAVAVAASVSVSVSGSGFRAYPS
jgi:hypothetical protein